MHRPDGPSSALGLRVKSGCCCELENGSGYKEIWIPNQAGKYGVFLTVFF